MSNPPREIDGARVIEWAWSGSKPFGTVCFPDGKVAAEIFGLALCKYPNSEIIYRFSCDSDWESEQDSEYASIQEAKAHLPSQYQNVVANWQKYD
ncbi:hypothetical protein [Microbulbifer variabilis]|uniref:hypothetical protein n=1 Tax=Microbulbifer variabilis TaxID=266805 RepID=UPI000361656F|nr:hypothetical protein [Microbulbifer variabilis]